MHRTTLPDGRGLWLVTRYDDVVAVLKDARFVKSWREVLSPAQREKIPFDLSPFGMSMLDMDPPDHTRLRALVQRAFTAPFVERLRWRVQELADELLDAVARRGAMDLIDDFAFPLPILVIAEVLGVPGKDRYRIRRWASALVSSSFQTRETMYEILPELNAFAEYVRRLCEARRADPGADLVSALIRAQEEGHELSERELISMVFLLLIAGHETTVNLLGNGMLALFQHPAELEALREDPSLIKSAVEELLRYCGPVHMATTRFAREDLELGGALIPKGESVMAVLASADRDPAHFEAPASLDLRRADNKHLAFGHGIHYCLGAPLARMEGQIGIATLLRRLPDLRLATAAGELRWRPSLLIRGLQRMPVAFTPG